MLHLGIRNRATTTLALVTALAMTAMMLLLTGGSPASSATGHRAAAGSFTTIAHNSEGKAKSKIVGTTSKGQKVTGYMTPLSLTKKNGHVQVKGLVSGVVHKADGSTQTFSATKTMKLSSINGTVPGAAKGVSGKASCNILNLVLAPLDLDLLGLKVHLDKVVLNIVAQSGAGNLLGNLLCAVTGLLDGGGALSSLLTKLGQILDQLLMGL